jgi:hypothetical protein
VAIDWREGGRARLLYGHGGTWLKTSREFEWPDSAVHRLRLETPALAALDAPGENAGTAGRLRADVDGAGVFDERVPSYPATSDALAIGSAGLEAELSCAVIEIQQEGLGSAPAPRDD